LVKKQGRGARPKHTRSGSKRTFSRRVGGHSVGGEIENEGIPVRKVKDIVGVDPVGRGRVRQKKKEGNDEFMNRDELEV